MVISASASQNKDLSSFVISRVPAEPGLAHQRGQQQVHTPRWISFALGSRPEKSYGRLDARAKQFFRERERRSLPVVKQLSERQLDDGHNYSIVMPVGSPLNDEEELRCLTELAGTRRLLQ